MCCVVFPLHWGPSRVGRKPRNTGVAVREARVSQQQPGGKPPNCPGLEATLFSQRSICPPVPWSLRMGEGKIINNVPGGMIPELKHGIGYMLF